MAGFWQGRTLESFSEDEWEQLCDRCGKCCLAKLEDIDTGRVHYTAVHCRLLDPESAQCTDYRQRKTRVSDCIAVTVELARRDDVLPHSCSYRRLARGEALPSWHPLLAGSADAASAAGQSVAGRTVSEDNVPAQALEEYLIRWVESG